MILLLSCVAPWVCNSPLNLGVVGSSKPDCLFLQCVAKVSIFDARFHQTVEIHWLLNGWSSVFPPPAKVLFPLVLSTQSAIFAVTPRNPRLPPKIPPTNQPPQKNQQQQHKKTKEAKTKTNPRCCLLLWASEHKAKKKPAFQPLFVFLSPFFTFSPPPFPLFFYSSLSCFGCLGGGVVISLIRDVLQQTLPQKTQPSLSLWLDLHHSLQAR